MFKILAFYTLLAFTTSAFGASSTVIEATNTEGFFSSQNLIRDPGFEGQNKGAAWTKSGGTLTISSTSPGRGGYMGVWASSAAAQTLKSKLTVIPAGLQGRNGVVSCLFKAATGTATHTLTASDGTNDLATATTITSSTTGFQRTSVNFIFPSSGSVQLKMVSVSASEPVLNTDDCYLGPADGFNLGSVSQATLVGTIKWVSTASCNWASTSGTYANYSTVASCATNARTVTGAITDASSGLRPAFGLPAMGPGEYMVVVNGMTTAFSNAASSGLAGFFRLYDGTTQYGEDQEIFAGGASFNGLQVGVPSTVFTFSLTSGIGAKTFDIQPKAAGVGGVAAIDVTGAPLKISVYRFPTSSETVYRADQMGSSWSGYHDGAPSAVTCDWARTNTAFGDPTADTTCNLIEKTNSNFGTVSASGSVLPAITFTPKRIGSYHVCANIATYGQTIGAVVGSRLWDGTTVIDEKSFQAPVSNYQTQIPLCGIYKATSLAPVTLSVQTKASTGYVEIYSNSGPAIAWDIYTIDQSIPTPVFVGSVTSGSAGAERFEAAGFGGNSSYTACTTGACTLIGSYAAWMTSLTQASAGVYNAVFPAGTWSSAPICGCTANANVATPITCVVNSIPTTTTAQVLLLNQAGAATNGAGTVWCKGAK